MALCRTEQSELGLSLHDPRQRARDGSRQRRPTIISRSARGGAFTVKTGASKTRTRRTDRPTSGTAGGGDRADHQGSDVPADRPRLSGDSWKNAKHRQQCENTLETYVHPTLGHLPVKTINRDLVVRVLQPIWHDKPETSRRIRMRIETIVDYAIARKVFNGDARSDKAIARQTDRCGAAPEGSTIRTDPWVRQRTAATRRYRF